MNKRVFIAGYFGFHNTGDEAILAAMLSSLRAIRPDVKITVTSGTPEETAAGYGVDTVLWSDAFAIAESVRSSDLVIVGGGGLFHDYWGFDPGAFLTDQHSGIGFYTAPAVLGALYGKPVFLWAVGVGPLMSRQGQLFTRVACEAARVVTVRDAASKRLLESMGIDPARIQVTADAAFAFIPGDPNSSETHSKRPLSLAVAVRPWEVGVLPAYWETELASTLDRYVELHDGEVIFVPFQRLEAQADDDLRAAQRVHARMKHRDKVAFATASTPSEIYHLLSACGLVIGMRLHSLILGMLAGVPVIALGYDAKNAELMGGFALQDQFLDLKSIDSGVLTAMIERTLAAPDGLRTHVAGQVQHAKVLALQNARAAIDLLERSDDCAPALSVEMQDVLGRGLYASLRQAQRLRSEVQRTSSELLLCLKRIGDDAAKAEEMAVKLDNIHRERQQEQERASAEAAELRLQIQKLEEAARKPVLPPVPAVPLPDLGPALERLAPQQTYDVVIFAVCEFDSRFQRPQHVATGFARMGHRVFWISPFRTLPASDPRPYEAIPLDERLWVVHLRERYEIFTGELSADAAQSSYRSIRQLYADFSIAESCALLQFPFWRGLGLLLREKLHARLTYDCMDDWQNWTAYPGVGRFSLEEEKKLDQEADLVVVSSQEYFRRRQARNLPALLVRNAVDFDFFSSPADVHSLAAMAGPVIGYYGAISDWFDYALLARAAAERPQYSFVLIGDPRGIDESRLPVLPNVHLLGEKDYREIPGYLAQFDVCMIPFLVNKFTRGVDPVKLYEYLSQGKPVVASALPELPVESGLIYSAAGPADFIQKLDAAVNEDDAALRQRRVEYARRNTWASRLQDLDQAIAQTYPRVSILVVTYNSEDFLGLCLTAIRRNTAWPNYEIVVVDNASQDATAAVLQKYAAADPRIRAVLQDRNTGFPAGNNIAARQASGRYLIFLNADTIVTPGWLERLVRHSRSDPKVGQVAAVTNFSGNETKINASYRDVGEMMELAQDLARRKPGQYLEIGIAPLYCVLMPRDVWDRVGELDEIFGMGTFEDDDLSLRVREAGYRVIVADDAFVHHFGNASFRKIPEQQAAEIFTENKRRYEEKWQRPAPRHSLRPGVRSPYREPMYTPGEFVQRAAPQAARSRKAILHALHPQTAVTGAGFNVQSSGHSALAVTCEDAGPDTVIAIDGCPLPTSYVGPNSLSALVPSELTDVPGRYRVSLLDRHGESNSLEFLTRSPQEVAGSLPLVTCIMPTSDRPAFVPRAIRQFLVQDYPARELIVIDAGRQAIGHLISPDPRIRYIRAGSQLPLGALRNLGCREAAGSYIAHWDDDDWVAPWRLSYQMQALLHTDADVCGIDRMFYWDPVRNQAWRYTYPLDQRPWLAGGSLVYRRTLWEKQPFQEIDVGEDNTFVWDDTPKRMAHLDHEDFYIALLHSGNTSPKLIDPTRWIPVDPGPIIVALGPDALECRDLVLQHEGARTEGAAPIQANGDMPARFRAHSVSPSAVARRCDLDLPEFAALRHAYPLPPKRRWELPFALFQARLSDQMSVLDCSTNPTGFAQIIAALFPYVQYQNVSLLADGQLDSGNLPEEDFDRVFAIAALDRLTGPQREHLVSALAGKLKPGGRLVVTCEDGKVTLTHLEELCRSSGLLAVAPPDPNSAAAEPPPEAPPFDSSVVGAVFMKPPETATQAARVVLGLLAWNTREIAMESLAGLCDEARMLLRVGHQAAVCVVDNGSDDGTADELRRLDGNLEIPHRFILNSANVGSSRARNQIVDFMLEWGAEYVLFMDGDIEIVPCSSFAMLRHLESSGSGVGCIGAYSAHHTAERTQATPVLFSLAQCRLHSSEILAWTQYGMFRRRLFESGIRFEENGPFGEPGHGLEDVDLALQMLQRGFANEYFEGIRYLHRHLSSSVEILRRQGINPTRQYYRRKEYLLSKWEDVDGISANALRWLRQARAPWTEDVVAEFAGRPLDLPPKVMNLVQAHASEMINAQDLGALAAALVSFPWSGQELAVEIGAYVGSTTVFIAKVLDALGVQGSVVAIDPFERCTPDALNPQGSYTRFMENIRAHGVEGRCIPLASFSSQAAPLVPERIGVLFIDGSHHYDAVRADLDLYAPKVVPGGFLYIHDYFDAYPGVIRAVDEFTAEHPDIERVARGNYVVLRAGERGLRAAV